MAHHHHANGRKPGRKKVKLRFALAEVEILDKLMIKKSEKQVLKRPGNCVSLAEELGNSLKEETGRDCLEGGKDVNTSVALEIKKGARNSDRKRGVKRKMGHEKEAKEGGREGRSRKIPPSLTTSNPYYVECGSDQQDKLTEVEVPSLQQRVEVPCWREDKNHYDHNKGGPTWRVKSINLLNITEATEPIDDDSYLKRHDKHERAEKQRKRWDAQRMRREQQLQELRARQEKKSLQQPIEKSNCLRVSLLPAPEEAKVICVEEAIPVSVFGRPLPDIEAEDFGLPWL